MEINERFPYKEEVTGSNPVAPTRVFQKSTLIKYKTPHRNPTIMLFLVKFNFMKSDKPNLEERTVDFNGKEIKVTNWWNWRGQGAADLYLDGEHLDQDTSKVATGKKVLLSNYDYSDEIKSIEVYASYFFKLKLKILVNGNIVHKD